MVECIIGSKYSILLNWKEEKIISLGNNKEISISPVWKWLLKTNSYIEK